MKEPTQAQWKDWFEHHVSSDEIESEKEWQDEVQENTDSMEEKLEALEKGK